MECIFSASSNIQSPLSTLLEYTGILRTRSHHSELNNGAHIGYRDHHLQSHLHDSAPPVAANGIRSAVEVSIRILGDAEDEHDTVGTVLHSAPTVGQLSAQTESSSQPISRSVSAVSVLSTLENLVYLRSDQELGDGVPHSTNASGDTDAAEGAGVHRRDSSSSYQRYDIQQAARWTEQVLPFVLLLMVVFIHQHLEGFFATIWIAAFMFKSNNIGERRIFVLIVLAVRFTLHVLGFYWWYENDDLLYPFLMLPPKAIPPFCDTHYYGNGLKCVLLMYYKNNTEICDLQGQMLTLVEYLLLLYRALLPAPYGSLFSSLMTGLYLTFKLTSDFEKVIAIGDLCAICQETMHSPILLRCKHILFERERTCPFCRALVKPIDLKSFGDGSTSLFYQLF
ncbi:hypothetical protein Pfo_004532 [Paulownia fortunei]|nr:hypothetical protein Pfo_004532 [Paulownia fortunei]